ncbi:MAG: 1-phosphofructokinase [Eubacteriaceae bacterium]
MIYTVTFNPSLDYIVGLDVFKNGEINRTAWEHIFPGGKGINVSMVLNNLGIENTALGFVGGFTGEEIQKALNVLGCQTDFVKLASGKSRINVKIKADVESEINGQGPEISKEELEQLFAQLDRLGEGDILVLAGSTPAALPEDMYEIILKRLKDRGIKIVVDASGDLLVKVLKYHPFLIKPNNHELGEIFGVELKTKEDLINHGKKLQEMGAQNILISMAGDGAIFIGANGEIHSLPAPKGEVKNSVGAGDSMVAGFIAGYLKNQDFEEGFKNGVATGSASAFSERLATQEDVEKLLRGM